MRCYAGRESSSSCFGESSLSKINQRVIGGNEDCTDVVRDLGSAQRLQ